MLISAFLHNLLVLHVKLLYIVYLSISHVCCLDVFMDLVEYTRPHKLPMSCQQEAQQSPLELCRTQPNRQISPRYGKRETFKTRFALSNMVIQYSRRGQGDGGRNQSTQQVEQCGAGWCKAAVTL